MNTFLFFYKSLLVNSILSPYKVGMRRGEYITLVLIISLIESNNGIVTQADVIKANKDIPRSTTYRNIKMLIDAGYLNSERGRQFFARSYLTLTDKALLLQSRIKSLLEE